MKNNLNAEYELISSEDKITNFVDSNKNSLKILTVIKPQLTKHFPNSTFSLELCDKLEWTTEEKLLINVHVTENMFFNGILTHFNEIYENIDYLLDDIFCPIVLFPFLSNDSYDRLSNNCAINLIAKTSYFNRDFDKNLQREMSLRNIPKSQMKKEIIEYCNNHPNPDLSDIVFDLQLDLFDVDSLIDEIESEGMKLNVKW